jgi:hypothetical protein
MSTCHVCQQAVHSDLGYALPPFPFSLLKATMPKGAKVDFKAVIKEKGGERREGIVGRDKPGAVDALEDQEGAGGEGQTRRVDHVSTVCETEIVPALTIFKLRFGKVHEIIALQRVRVPTTFPFSSPSPSPPNQLVSPSRTRPARQVAPAPGG